MPDASADCSIVAGRVQATSRLLAAAGVRFTPTSEHNAVQKDNSGQEAALEMAGLKQAVTTGPTALFQKLQCQLSTRAVCTSTDGCIVAGRVRPSSLIAHGLHECKSMLPLTKFFTSTDC